MVARSFLASVSADDLKMLHKVFNQLRVEFGFAPRSGSAQRLALDLIEEFQAGTVEENHLRTILRTALLAEVI